MRIRDRQVTDLDLSGDDPETLAVINAMINAGLRFGAEGLIGPEITALEFEAGFAEQYHLSIEALRRFWTVRRCICAAEDCQGWALMSIEIAEMEKHYADPNMVVGNIIPGSVIEGRP